MSDPVFVQFPPRLSLFNTTSALAGGTYLPLASTEDNDLNLTEAAIGLMVSGFAVLVFVSRPNQDWFSLFFLGSFGLLGFAQIWRSLAKILRVKRYGPNRVTISPEGISVSTSFTGVLRWTEIASVIVQQHHGKVYSATIRPNDPASFAGRRLQQKLRDDPYVKVDLRSFPSANEIGQAMIGAANKFSGKHIGGMDLPLFGHDA